MIFSSLEFIFRFLPVFLILYFFTPRKFKNITLFLGSMIFYSFGDLKYIVLLLALIVLNYQLGLWIDTAHNNKDKRKKYLIIGLSMDFMPLFYYKYSNFFLECLDKICRGKMHIQEKQLSMPLGISFFTFTIVAYLVDVYRDNIKAEREIIKVATYWSMFPQLISGPIVRYGELKEQLAERKITFARVESGVKIFTIGLGYKVILADQLSTLWNSIQTIGFESISTPLAWLGVVTYSLQIYFDFNGYSLMAIGLGEMIGFSLPINFAHPYMSRSVGEFWRRWHITLGKWFKDYVYIPLGGNRKGTPRVVVNLFIVWLLTGLWHGAGFNFLFWGFYLFAFIACEKVFLSPYLRKHKVISRIYLLVAIGLSWMIFAITDFSEILMYFSRLFPIASMKHEIVVNRSDVMKQLKTYWPILSLSIFFSMPYAMRWYLKRKKSLTCIVLLTVVFWYSIYLLALGNENPFLYFKF